MPPVTIVSCGFWSDFLPNLLATLVGAIAGIPIGLGLASRAESKTTKARESQKLAEGRQIVGLLRSELQDNREAVRMIASEEKDFIAIVDAATKLRDDLWLAISNGGQVGLIRDPGLISAVASAYASVRVLKLLADLFFKGGELVRTPGSQGFTPFFDTMRKREATAAEGRIETAIASIGSHLEKEPGQSGT